MTAHQLARLCRMIANMTGMDLEHAAALASVILQCFTRLIRVDQSHMCMIDMFSR